MTTTDPKKVFRKIVFNNNSNNDIKKKIIKYLEPLVFQSGGVIFPTKMAKLIQEALGVCATFLFH